MMDWGRTSAILQKEVLHILRDPFTVALSLLLPVIVVVLFGLGIEFNIRNIKIAVYDGDRSQSSRKLIEIMGASEFFRPEITYSQKEAAARVNAEKDKAALIIEPKFEYHLLSGRGAQAQLLLDGSDSSAVGPTMGYMLAIEALANQKITGQHVSDLVNLKTRFLFNPELNSRWFIVPGLLVLILGLLSNLLTSLTIAREWENGSMELLLSTPVKPIEIIIGKIIPYMILGLGSVVMVYLVARGVMGVPFRGSHFVLLLGSVLYLSTFLALGVLISALTRTQQLAMQVSMMLGYMPAIAFSGFIFPIESMPSGFRYLTALMPARWFTDISRDLFLMGSSLRDLSVPFMALTVSFAVVIIFTARNFKKDVEP